MDNQNAEISMATFRRMPLYLRCLYEMQDNGKEYVSTVALAEGVFKNPSVVKKDLSYVIKNEGKPKVGHKVKDLINDIEEFLGYDNTHDAILVGVGKLGQALLGYKGFDEWGLRIVAGFDVNSDIVGKTINGKEIIDMKQMPTEIAKRNIKMAVLTNGYTASAAELFTCALKDYKKAVIVGEKTYGKGCGQSVIPLPDGTGLSFTTFLYDPPVSENYNGVGITPDVEKELSEEASKKNIFELQFSEDDQLKAALEALK